jgi:hypothetical protein
MIELTEERLAELIAALPPAPTGWVQAAVELPDARAAIDQLVGRAFADEEARRRMLADLEQTLREAGIEPQRPILDGLRDRLTALEP